MTKNKLKRIPVLISVILLFGLLVGLLYIMISERKQEKLYDLDKNGSVGLGDLLLVSLKSGTQCNFCPEDLNKDGVIDQTDLSLLQEIID